MFASSYHEDRPLGPLGGERDDVGIHIPLFNYPLCSFRVVLEGVMEGSVG